MIIDPDMEGCTIWHKETVQHIKGTFDECAIKIIKTIVYKYEDNFKQYIIPTLDTIGIGIAYAEIFDKYDIEYVKVKHGAIVGSVKNYNMSDEDFTRFKYEGVTRTNAEIIERFVLYGE